MSPEQITQWAKEAGGCQLADYDCAFALNSGSLTRFAALIRDMTLEEAAAVCDARKYNCIGTTFRDMEAAFLADAIRDLKGGNK